MIKIRKYALKVAQTRGELNVESIAKLRHTASLNWHLLASCSSKLPVVAQSIARNARTHKDTTLLAWPWQTHLYRRVRRWIEVRVCLIAGTASAVVRSNAAASRDAAGAGA